MLGKRVSGSQFFKFWGQGHGKPWSTMVNHREPPPVGFAPSAVAGDRPLRGLQHGLVGKACPCPPPRQNRFHPRTPVLLGRRTTCSEPVAVIERAARGARVVPVAGELSRRPDDDLAVLAGIQHPRPRLRVHDLQPRQAVSVPRPTGRIAAGCHPDWRPGCPSSR